MRGDAIPPELPEAGRIASLDAFPPERRALLDLLRGLSPGDWARPTVCDGWSVQDLAAHLVADDLGRLSGQRDGHRHGAPEPGRLFAWIDRRNHEWVDAMRRLSGSVLISLLELGGEQSHVFFRSLDPDAPGVPVSWAALEPTPVWLDLARELTERWHHQAQIRLALDAPMLDDPRILRPVLEAFAFALPVTFATVDAAPGTAVTLEIPGAAGGVWTVRRGDSGWGLFTGADASPGARVVLAAEDAWRMYTRTLPPSDIRAAATISGDPSLAERLLTAVAIVADVL